MSDFSNIFKGRTIANVGPTTRSQMALDAIQDRQQSTRPLRPPHVEALAESISVLGLLEPLVVDRKGRLLAGGHRLAALKYLQTNSPETFAEHFPNDQIPVRVMDFDATENPDRALECEVAENEHRQDYTRSEVRALADRLRQAGYVDRPGRPMKGEKALRPALKVIVGKSLGTVRRYLNQDENAHPTGNRDRHSNNNEKDNENNTANDNDTTSGNSNGISLHHKDSTSQNGTSKKTRSVDRVFSEPIPDEVSLLQHIQHELQQWRLLKESQPLTQASKRFLREVPSWVALLDDVIKEAKQAEPQRTGN